MAGHSKWANIQHRKNAQDAKRGKVFTKLIREITVAARMGDPDPASNARLRLAVDNAYGHNMPKDTIERAIKRGAGVLDEGEQYEEVRYEGYGPGGTAIMVDCLTEKRTRTVADVRHAFTKYGGNLGTDGSVSYLFTKTGVIHFPPGSDENKIMEIALEAGAEDVIGGDDNSFEVLTPPDDFEQVKTAMSNAGLNPDYAEITMRATTRVMPGPDDARQVLKLMEVLDELDDVQNVYTNAEFSDEVLESE